MTPEVAALFVAIAFAPFAVYGGLGLVYSTRLTARATAHNDCIYMGCFPNTTKNSTLYKS